MSVYVVVVVVVAAAAASPVQVLGTRQTAKFLQRDDQVGTHNVEIRANINISLFGHVVTWQVAPYREDCGLQP